MFSIKSVVVAVLIVTVLTADCTAPVTMVPNAFLSSFFSTTLGTINSPTDFRNLLSNPSIDTLTTYVKAQATYILPLWCLAGLILLFLVGCCFQICCYNCCRVRYFYSYAENVVAESTLGLTIPPASTVPSICFSSSVCY